MLEKKFSKKLGFNVQLMNFNCSKALVITLNTLLEYTLSIAAV